jgi:hypothetical protein
MEQNQRILRQRNEVGGSTSSRLHRVLTRHAEVDMNTRSTGFAEDEFSGDGLSSLI